MADTKGSALGALTTLADDDLINVIDVSDTTMGAGGTNKKITKTNFKTTLDVASGTHTHTASQVTDFDTEVSNNTDVAANTAARNNATKIQNVNIDATVATPSDGDILVYRSAGTDWVLEAKPTGSGGGTPGGSTTQVQFNDAGSFGGDAQLTYNKTTDTLDLAGTFVADIVKVRDSTFSGDFSATLTSDQSYTLPDASGTVALTTDIPSTLVELDTTVTGTQLNSLKTKVDGIEALADVTDATNVAAAGAVMESDTSTASMSFVIDEDDMTSNSATKVPTQQSVKAYVDAAGGGGGSSPVYTEVANIQPNFVMNTGGWSANTNGAGATLGASTEGYLRMQASSSFAADTLAAYQKTDYSFIDTTYNVFDKNMRITAVLKSIQATNSPSESFFGTVDLAMASASNIPFTKTVKHIGIYRTTGSGSSTYTASNANGTTQTSTTFSGPTNEKFASWRIDYTAGTDIKYYLNGTLVATHTTNLPTGAQSTSGTSLCVAIGNTGAISGTAPELYLSAAKLEVEA